MTLERLCIRNFQRHAKLTIEFDPHVTVLVGRSDIGKSAVLRALRWIATNRPAGDAYLRHGADHVYARLHLDNGRTILRERCPGLNAYSLDSHRYQSFGQDVPDDIANLLNLGAVNWQFQHDSPFWFSLTPGEVGKELNAVVNLDLIDRTLSSLASDLRRTKVEADITEKRLTDARQQRDALAWTKDAHTALQRAEAAATTASAKRLHATQFTSSLANATLLAKQTDVACNAAVGVAMVATATERAVQLGGKATRLRQLLGDIRLADKAIAAAPSKEAIDQLDATINIAVDAGHRDGNLRALLQQIQATEDERCQICAEAEGHEKQLSMAQICPICDRPFP